jgi:hypothetical protein
MSDIRPPAVGELAPAFSAVEAMTGAVRDIGELTPLVLVFYRGHW